jgi:hypothetical protein
MIPQVKQTDSPRLDRRNIEKLALLLVGLIAFYQLIIPPIVGLADNGDFWKVSSKLGLKPIASDPESRFWNYILVKYEIISRANPYEGLLTSEFLIGEAAFQIWRILSKEAFFDIRFLAVTRLAFLLLAIGLSLWAARTFKPLTHILLSMAVVLVFTDASYLLYFNSFFTEPSSFLFIGLTTALFLVLITREEPRIGLLALWFVTASLFVCSKPQNSPLGLLLAGFGLGLSRLGKGRPWKFTASVLSICLCLLSYGYYLRTPPEIKEVGLYNSVFFELLRFSPSPQKDLQALGLQSDLGSYANTHAFEAGSPMKKPEFRKAFFDQVGIGNVLKFYLTHPTRFLRLMRRSAKVAFVVRYTYLGNFDRWAGLPPKSQSHAFRLWSTLKGRLVPNSLWFIIGFFGFNAVVVLLIYRQTHDIRQKIILEFAALIVLMAMAQFMIVAVGDCDIEISRHLFLFNVLFDLCVIFDFLWIASKLQDLISEGLRPDSLARWKARLGRLPFLFRQPIRASQWRGWDSIEVGGRRCADELKP